MHALKSSSPMEEFQRYFSVSIANHVPEDLDAILKIRYRVYCQEFRYEPENTALGQRETDDFDDQSIHCLIRHIPSGMPAGCIRVVTVDDESLMPMERFCSESFDPARASPLMADREDICEVSRLAVDPAFRRRSGEHVTRFGDPRGLDVSTAGSRVFSLISVAAFLCATAVSDLIGRRHCFAMMEPFLPRMLARAGIIAEKIGAEIEYHGARAPYCMRTDDVIDNLGDDLRGLYAHIHQAFEQSGQFRDTRPAGVAYSMGRAHQGSTRQQGHLQMLATIAPS